MFVEDVRALFDQYVDEPDLTFLTVAQRRQALSRGYESFRQLVLEGDEFGYAIQQDYAITDAETLNLSTSVPPITGSTAVAGAQLQRLLRIAQLGATSSQHVWQFLKATRTLDTVLPRTYVTTWADSPTTYILIGDTLNFSRQISATIRLWYIPSQNVDWTLDTVGSHTYIDDYGLFHKLIAMYAARDYYTTRDEAVHQRLEQQIRIEETRLSGYLAVGRDTEANATVAERF